MLINVWAAVPVAVLADKKLDRADDLARESAVAVAVEAEVIEVVDEKAGGVLEAAPEGKPVVAGEKAKRLPESLSAALRKIDEAYEPEFKLVTKSVARELQSLYFNSDETSDKIAEIEKSGGLLMGAWGWDGNPVRDQHPDLIQYMPRRVILDEDGIEIGEKAAILEDTNLVYGQAPRKFIA